MKIPSKIYYGQIHRLILFGILHANLVHLISNLFSQIILGFIIEDLIGTYKTSLLYLLSNVCGGLFSCVMNKSAGVGASVAIFGILGGYFGFTVINWELLKNNMNYLLNMVFLIIIVIANASFGIGNETIDNYGHLGGLIYGFLFIFYVRKSYLPLNISRADTKSSPHHNNLLAVNQEKRNFFVCTKSNNA